MHTRLFPLATKAAGRVVGKGIRDDAPHGLWIPARTNNVNPRLGLVADRRTRRLVRHFPWWDCGASTRPPFEGKSWLPKTPTYKVGKRRTVQISAKQSVGKSSWVRRKPRVRMTADVPNKAHDRAECVGGSSKESHELGKGRRGLSPGDRDVCSAAK